MNHKVVPITVAVANDYPIIVEGLAELLRNDARFDVVELDLRTLPHRSVDLVLFDTFATRDRRDRLVALIEDRRFGAIVVFSWDCADDVVREAIRLGAAGVLCKDLGAHELAEGLLLAHRGKAISRSAPGWVEPDPVLDWPDRENGLTPREGEIVSLITQGRTNHQIAAGCFLSINSVKSYIRSAYRKMGVERRSQAVLWGVQNGMAPTEAPSARALSS